MAWRNGADQTNVQPFACSKTSAKMAHPRCLFLPVGTKAQAGLFDSIPLLYQSILLLLEMIYDREVGDAISRGRMHMGKLTEQQEKLLQQLQQAKQQKAQLAVPFGRGDSGRKHAHSGAGINPHIPQKKP